MAKRTTNGAREPDITPEYRLSRIADVAWEEMERRVADGTAKDSTLQFIVKMENDRRKQKLEEEKLEVENRLNQSKIEAIEASTKAEIAYKEVLQALSRYSGHREFEDVGFDDEDLQ